MTAAKGLHPLISVIIPSFNHGEFVKQALRSVYDQSYRPLELIVVDDGSSDDSVEIIRSTLHSLQKNGDRPLNSYRVFSCQHRGAHVALNKGLRAAHGSWLAILNSDDAFSSTRLDQMWQLCRQQRKDWAFSKVRFIDFNDQAISNKDSRIRWYNFHLRQPFPTVGFRLLYSNVLFSTGNLFFSRRLWENVGPFASYRILHDYDFAFRALEFSEPLLIKQPLLTYRIHGRNTSTSGLDIGRMEAIKLAQDLAKRFSRNKEPKNVLAPWSTKNRATYRKLFRNKNTFICKTLGTEKTNIIFDF